MRFHHRKAEDEWLYLTWELEPVHWGFYGMRFDENTDIDELLALHPPHTVEPQENGNTHYHIISTKEKEVMLFVGFLVVVDESRKIIFAGSYHDVIGWQVVLGDEEPPFSYGKHETFTPRRHPWKDKRPDHSLYPEGRW